MDREQLRKAVTDTEGVELPKASMTALTAAGIFASVAGAALVIYLLSFYLQN